MEIVGKRKRFDQNTREMENDLQLPEILNTRLSSNRDKCVIAINKLPEVHDVLIANKLTTDDIRDVLLKGVGDNVSMQKLISALNFYEKRQLYILNGERVSYDKAFSKSPFLE